MARMIDTLKAEDLGTEACLTLAAEILKGAAEAYITAKIAVLQEPGRRDLAGRLQTRRAFYRSEYFTVLSNGMADGEAVMRMLDKEAERRARR